MSDPPHDAEEFERIPWGHLSSSAPSRPVNWRLAAYGLAGALAVAGITAALVSGGDPVPTTHAPTVVAPTLGVSASATTVASTVTSSSSAALTEAELMAIPAGLVAGEAAAWAEVLTEAYWGVDGSGVSTLAPYLPPDSPLPVPAEGQRVFVESVRALSVTEESPGLYRVVVRASLLSALGSDEYRRLPIQALAWTLRWQREGWRLLDFPEQIELPHLLPATELPSAEIPEGIRSAASQTGTVLAGGPVGDLWRVVVALEDSLGGSWPVVRWFSPDGTAVAG
ncbi:MAG: hypothetical protein ACRDWA_06770 [Acidimicrobiia bacterium]